MPHTDPSLETADTATDLPADEAAELQQRRQALARLGRAALYAAPATLAMLSMEAKACSLTC